MMKAFPGSTFEIAKRVTKGTTIVYVKDELEKIAQKEAELKIKEAERKEAHRIARTRAFFNSLLWQDNVKVSLGKVTLINDIRLFQVVYDLASTRYSFVDLMKLKEDTGLTVKFEVIRVKNETETVEQTTVQLMMVMNFLTLLFLLLTQKLSLILTTTKKEKSNPNQGLLFIFSFK